MCCIVPNSLYLCVIKPKGNRKNKKIKHIVMKASKNKFATIEPVIMEELTREVKETLAPAHVLSQHKTFSAADLWNIQRQARTRVNRRFL